jgi:hypothetical protein
MHRQAEKVIEESRIPFTFLRPNFFMQNFINFYLADVYDTHKKRKLYLLHIFDIIYAKVEVS